MKLGVVVIVTLIQEYTLFHHTPMTHSSRRADNLLNNTL